MALSGIKHKMSTSYHPETDGVSEHSNKTTIQALRFHVERNQKGWCRALPQVRFDIMNTVNASTGQLNTDVMEAQDNLLEAKIQQAHLANQFRKPEHIYEIGDRVLLSTINR